MREIADRIASMSKEEMLRFITALQNNRIPPYRLHTHVHEFIVDGYLVDRELKVEITPRARRALDELGTDRVQEIAETVSLHPSLGKNALEAMFDGFRVIIAVEKVTPRNGQMTQSINRQMLN